MPEDDVDMLDPDGSGAGRVDRDRRAPRFSWTPAYEATFFRSLCESVQLGMRENSSFKAEAWERAAQALQKSHGAYPAKSHLINKSDNARKRFRLWRGLREDPDFQYNPLTRTVTASEEAWKAHVEREPLSRALRGRPFDHEEYMEVLYPDVIGSGGAPKRITKPRRRTDGQPGDDSDMPGTGVLNLQAESSSTTEFQKQQQQPPPPLSQQQLRPINNSTGAQRPELSQTPSVSSSNSAPHHQQGLTTAISPPSAAPQPSALTPPDESTQSRKRMLAMGPPQDASEASILSIDAPAIGPPYQSPEKRRRTSLTGDSLPAPSTVMLNSSMPPIRRPVPMEASPALSGSDTVTATRTGFDDLMDVLRASSRPPYRDMALDVFFRDFAGEDMDFQIKISEGVLCDENRAMVFCKMPPRLRQHWVARLREGYR